MIQPIVLFLCTGNSCRSQMAEGWARHLHGDHLVAYSAGIVAKGVNPHAAAVMSEVGIDLNDHASKTVESLRHIPFDWVVTVCGHADATCPAWIARDRVLHVGFDDPPELAKTASTAEVALGHYRRVRDEIRAFVEGLPDRLMIRVTGS